jgi:hypothetical protein
MAGEHTGARNYGVAHRVWSGALTSAGYQAQIDQSDREVTLRRARTFSMTRPELTDADMERIRDELPNKIAQLRHGLV